MLKIDEYTKYIDVNEFNFDNTFNENYTKHIYNINVVIRPLFDNLILGGIATFFIYEQTGSCKKLYNAGY